MQSKSRVRACAGASVVAITMAATSAWAQAAAPAPVAANGTPPATPEAASTVPEVIVTSERRTINLQTSSLAAVAITGLDLKRDAVIDVSQLQFLAPSLSVTDTGLQRFINIRGIGANASLPNIQNGIVYEVDGVYTRSTFTEVPYYDTARVEILRGPQGTLSSQNAEGGSINVITESPRINGGITGYAEFGYANYSHVNAEAAINLPISDTLAARVALFDEDRDSYFKNIATSTDGLHYNFGNLRRNGGRVELLWKPTDNFSAQLRYEHYDRHSDGYAYKPTPGDPSNTFNGVVSYLVAPANPFTLAFDAPGRADLSIDRESLELKWNVLPWLQVRSLTSYLTSNLNSSSDEDGNAQTPPLGLGTANVRPYVTIQIINNRTLTQEVNLITSAPGPLQGVVGAYYYNANTPNSITNALIISNSTRSNTNGWAAFGQATYDLTDRIRFTAGIRQNQDQGSTIGSTLIRAILVKLKADSTYQSSATTGKVAVDFKVTPDEFLYALISRGYRSGGANTPPAPGFGPEYVMNYEAGLKSTLFDGHVRTQLDGFYDNYTGFQVNIFNPTLGTQIVENGPDATLYGVEFQGQAKFGDFSADGSLSYLNTRFGDRNGAAFFASDTRYAAGSPGFKPIEITGKSVPFAQPWTGYVGAQYAFQLEGAQIIPRIQYSYNGSQWSTIFQQPYDLIAAHHTIDLQVTYDHTNWQIKAYATNLENNTYVIGKFAGFEYYGAPREYGVKLDYRF